MVDWVSNTTVAKDYKGHTNIHPQLEIEKVTHTRQSFITVVRNQRRLERASLSRRQTQYVLTKGKCEERVVVGGESLL